MHKVFIIAEAGVNHNGSIELAKQLIDVAAEAGVDAVKFQTFRATELASVHAEKADYQKDLTDKRESQLDMLKRLELSEDDHVVLKAHAESRNIAFMSTPFDLASVSLLANLGMEVFKIASGEITNLPYLRRVAGVAKRIVLSSGLATMQEVQRAVAAIVEAGFSKENITVLHANTAYPTPPEDVNLLAMKSIGRTVGVACGYSDHTLGITVPIAAAALGATVIEKHFTLDRKMEGPDHAASLEPQELKDMVSAVRIVEAILGDGVKQPSKSESVNRNAARKSIVAKRPIAAGEMFSDENLAVKRPAGGIDPMQWDNVIGLKAVRAFEIDEPIQLGA